MRRAVLALHGAIFFSAHLYLLQHRPAVHHAEVIGEPNARAVAP